jgi:hypothetical protein
MMVGGRRRGLDDKHVLAAHVLLDLDERLAVRERADVAFAELDADVIANRMRQRFVAVPLKAFTNQMSVNWKFARPGEKAARL